MPEPAAKVAGKSVTEQAIAEIVKMDPRRVTVTLTLPVQENATRPVVTLEWTREDTHLALSDLLKRLESYVTQFGSR